MARSVIAEVEQEYGQPFWDVVRAYAADGNSMQMTAKILGYTNGSSLWYLINHHKIDIEFPKMGYCNAVQNPDPMREEDKKKISDIKRSHNLSAAGDYERRTGESAESAIRRLALSNTVAGTARAIGWNSASCMRAWMKIRGIDIVFKSYKPTPPRTRSGWADINFGGWKKARAKSPASRESVHP